VKQLLLEVETGEGERKDDMVPEELREGKLKVFKQMLEREQIPPRRDNRVRSVLMSVGMHWLELETERLV
jgi:hypothetical protein